MTISRDDKMSEYTTEATGTELQRRRAGDPIPDPGFPEAPARLTDTDPKAEGRAERQVAGMFGLAAVLVIAFLVFYVIFPIAADFHPDRGRLCRDAAARAGRYVGETARLQEHFAAHPRAGCFTGHKADCVGVHRQEDERARPPEERGSAASHGCASPAGARGDGLPDHRLCRGGSSAPPCGDGNALTTDGARSPRARRS